MNGLILSEEGPGQEPKATGYRYPNMKCAVTYAPWKCHTCGIKEDGEGVCEACARTCHRGHRLEYMKSLGSRCVCHGHGRCILANCSAQKQTTRSLKQWVCVSQPGENNRVFDRDQIAGLTGVQLRQILRLDEYLSLYVQSSTRRVRVPDDCVVLRDYPDIAIDMRPGIYDYVSKCLFIGPSKDGDILLLVGVTCVSSMGGDVCLPRMPVGLKESELDTLTTSGLLDKCRGQFSFEWSSCRLLINGNEVNVRNESVWPLLCEGNGEVALIVELSQDSNRSLDQLLKSLNSLADIEDKIIGEVDKIRKFESKAAEVFHVNERETIFGQLAKSGAAHALLRQWLFAPREV